jgi:hypothetical protein
MKKALLIFRRDNMNKIEKHEEICREIHEMYIKKNADYGDSVGELYKKLGDISFLTRISDKYNRLMNLMTTEGEQNYESIEDTIQDMANYCIIWLMEREMKKEDIDEEDEEDLVTFENIAYNLKNLINKSNNK